MRKFPQLRFSMVRMALLPALDSPTAAFAILTRSSNVSSSHDPPDPKHCPRSSAPPTCPSSSEIVEFVGAVLRDLRPCIPLGSSC